MDELHDRLQALERRVAELEARAGMPIPFRIVDPDGRTLLEVDLVHGSPALRLHDPASGKIAAVLFADEDGGNLDLYNREGGMVAGLTATADGGRVRVYNTAGKMIAALMATPSGGVCGLSSAEEEGKITLSTGPGGSVVGIQSGGLQTGLLLFADAAGGTLKLFDAEGNTVQRLP